MKKILFILAFIGSSAFAQTQDSSHSENMANEPKVEVTDSAPSAEEVKRQPSYFEVGVIANVSVLEVRERGGGTVFGKMRSSIKPLPILAFTTPRKFIKSSKFSYNFKVSAAWSELDTQLVGTDEDSEDKGTSVKTFSAFAMPVFSFSQDDIHFFNGNNQRLSINVGVGGGYFDADGEIILTEQIGEPTHELNISQFSFAAYVSLEFVWNQFLISCSAGGPLLNKDDFNYGLAEIAFKASYIFPMNIF